MTEVATRLDCMVDALGSVTVAARSSAFVELRSVPPQESEGIIAHWVAQQLGADTTLEASRPNGTQLAQGHTGAAERSGIRPATMTSFRVIFG